MGPRSVRALAERPDADRFASLCGGEWPAEKEKPGAEPGFAFLERMSTVLPAGATAETGALGR